MSYFNVIQNYLIKMNIHLTFIPNLGVNKLF